MVHDRLQPGILALGRLCSPLVDLLAMGNLPAPVINLPELVQRER